MNTISLVHHYEDENVEDLKSTIRSAFTRVLNLKKFRIVIKPTHSLARHIKRSFIKDVEVGDIGSFDYHMEGDKMVIELSYSDEKPCMISCDGNFTMAEALEVGKNYWRNIFKSLHVKCTSVDILEWMDDTNGSAKNDERRSSHRGVKHTPEWNKAIGDGRRGLRMKTKSREGVEWHWVNGKKEWM